MIEGFDEVGDLRRGETGGDFPVLENYLHLVSGQANAVRAAEAEGEIELNIIVHPL